ncbi:biotin--[acetyl-CoA-carboxylase] ligase [Glycomyces buryatensis]|uniref:biotin--[acetyl-CoA-carboxylase] ligase n=1 Tax=Glycomyces buryatensis TaxID=2570927 RepID=UPI001B3C15CF|nr:biotin--[acetyl-CoA-carboxylase] ligase [Glycomyces buryatensis]
MNTPTRRPLDRHALWSLLSEKSDFWTSIDVVQVTGSTNADLARAARNGAGEGTVLIAEEQTRGRGRLDRQWSCPPHAGLMMSFLLRPSAPRERWGTLSLATGVALEETLRATAGVSAKLKWPNDVLIDGKKVCGILAAVENGAVIVGMGLNVSLTEAELPVPEATSLALAGAEEVPREQLAADFLAHFAAVYRAWDADGPAGVIERWRRHSATLGRHVEVSYPNGDKLTGRAVDIAADGRLAVAHLDDAGAETVSHIAAGDIVHLRPRA